MDGSAADSPSSPSENNQQHPVLSGALQDLLRSAATARQQGAANAGRSAGFHGMGVPFLHQQQQQQRGPSHANTDLELLLMLHQQREQQREHQLMGINQLLLHSQQQQLQQPPASTLLSAMRDSRLFPAAMRNSEDNIRQQQAEALLALQSRGGPDVPLSLSNGNAPNGMPGTARMGNPPAVATAALPQDLSSLLATRLQRAQVMTESLAPQGGNKPEEEDAPEPEIANGQEEETEKGGEEEEETDGTAEDADHNPEFPVNDTFPYKLYRMLEDAEKQNQEDIVSFTKEGRAFLIHKADDFMAKIMPHFFTTTRMTSFQRQLNLYGFRRVTEGPDKGAYHHPHFVKGKISQCKKIKRKKNSVKPQPVFLPSRSSAPSEMNQFAGLPQGLHALGVAGFGSRLALGRSFGAAVHLPASMSSLAQNTTGLLELRQRQQAQSDLIRLLLEQQQQQQQGRVQHPK